VESLCATLEVTLADTVTTGARGDANWAGVAGDAGEAADPRIDDSGGGAGATKPARDTTGSVVVPTIWMDGWMHSLFTV
jgi:hypothetical protein